MKMAIIGYGKLVKDYRAIAKNAVKKSTRYLNEGNSDSEIQKRNLDVIGFLLGKSLSNRSVEAGKICEQLQNLNVSAIDILSVNLFEISSPSNFDPGKIFSCPTTPQALKQGKIAFLEYVQRFEKKVLEVERNSISGSMIIDDFCPRSRLINCLISVNSTAAVFMYLDKIEHAFSRWVDQLFVKERPKAHFIFIEGWNSILGFEKVPKHLMDMSSALSLISTAIAKIGGLDLHKLNTNYCHESISVEKFENSGHFSREQCLEIALKYMETNNPFLSKLGGKYIFKTQLGLVEAFKRYGTSPEVISKIISESILDIFSIQPTPRFDESLLKSIEVFDYNFNEIESSEYFHTLNRDALKNISVNFNAFKHYLARGIIDKDWVIDNPYIFSSYSNSNIERDGPEAYFFLVQSGLIDLATTIITDCCYSESLSIIAKKKTLDALESMEYLKMNNLFCSVREQYVWRLFILSKTVALKDKLMGN